MKINKPETWSRDHWSLLAYVECRCVDYRGQIENDHLRVNPKRHPAYAYSDRPSLGGRRTWASEYNTILNGLKILAGHDDIDCLQDLEAGNLIVNTGTGINPVYELTEEGWRVSAALRRFKAEGGTFAHFKYPKHASINEE